MAVHAPCVSLVPVEKTREVITLHRVGGSQQLKSCCVDAWAEPGSPARQQVSLSSEPSLQTLIFSILLPSIFHHNAFSFPPFHPLI